MKKRLILGLAVVGLLSGTTMLKAGKRNYTISNDTKNGAQVAIEMIDKTGRFFLGGLREQLKKWVAGNASVPYTYDAGDNNEICIKKVKVFFDHKAMPDLAKDLTGNIGCHPNLQIIINDTSIEILK